MTQTECIVCIVFEVNDCVDFSVSSLLTLLMLHQFHKCLYGASLLWITLQSLALADKQTNSHLKLVLWVIHHTTKR